jgi:hypothetical protein
MLRFRHVVPGAFVALALVAPGSAHAGWTQPSGASLNADPSLTVDDLKLADVGGTPYVAWVEDNATGRQLHVARLEGGAWVEPVPGSLNIDSSKFAAGPGLAIIGGVPYVSWSERDASNVFQVHVKRLADNAWVEPVPGSLNVDPSQDAVITTITGVAGVPYVGWEENDATASQIRVKRLEGGAWVQPQAASLNTDVAHSAFSPSLADVGGVPHVAFAQSAGGTPLQLIVKRLSGGTWAEPVPGSLNANASGVSDSPSLAVIGGVLHVSWEEDHVMRVKRLDGGAWNPVGAPLNASSGADGSSLADIGGTPYIAWGESSSPSTPRLIRVARFAAGAWTVIGGVLNFNTGQDIDDPSLLGFGGVPYVAWAEHVGAFPSEGGSLGHIERLEPDFQSLGAVPTATGATLSAQVDDFGVPLPVGFQLGTTPAFGTTLPPVTSAGTGVNTVTQTATGLAPSTGYSWNAFGTDGSRTTSSSPAQAFTTLAAPPPPAAVQVTALSVRNKVFRAAASGPTAKLARKKKARPIGTPGSFTLSGAGTAHFTIASLLKGFRKGARCVAKKPSKKARRCTRVVKAGAFGLTATSGPHAFVLSGRAGGHKLAPGRYRLSAIGDPGTATRTATFTVVRR